METKKDDFKFKNALINSIAGSAGGIALVFVGQPLDTVKVKMQTFPHLYKNIFDCTLQTILTSGISRGLYAGTAPALVANVSENSILFFCYGFCQKFVTKLTRTERIEDLSPTSNGMAGCLASFFSSIVLTPTELIKCKLQAMDEVMKLEATKGNKIKRVGPFKLTAEIFHEKGIRGLFRGLGPTLVREMPGCFFLFGSYEGARILFSNNESRKEDIGPVKTMIAGGIGGMFFWVTMYPIDMAKSRIQINMSNDYMHRIILRIVREEGFRALYKGLSAVLILSIPLNGVLLLTYEYSRKFLIVLFG